MSDQVTADDGISRSWAGGQDGRQVLQYDNSVCV